MIGPLISVIVPLHDHGGLVGEALDSIHAQDHRPLDVVVVDDGSRDGGAEVVSGYRPQVRLLRQPHAGAGSARNRGLEVARGELVVFFDADDLMAPGCLRRHATALERDPTLDGVYGDVVEFRDDPAARLAAPKPVRLPGSMLIRRRCLGPELRFEPELVQAEVVEWVARLMDHGLRLGHVPGVALLRRLHGANHGRGVDPAAYVRALHGVLQRRRGAG